MTVITDLIFEKDPRIVHLWGESGTGKTTLALQLIHYYLLRKHHSQVIWVQASERFPKKRFVELSRSRNTDSKLLLERVLIHPACGCFSDYDQQAIFLDRFATMILPPEIRMLCIDNISHHVRYLLSTLVTVKERSKRLNTFYDQQFHSFLMRCLRERILLILVHEVSFNPDRGSTVMYNYGLFERISGLSVRFTSDLLNGKVLCLQDAQNSHEYSYHIDSRGICCF
jgi:archaellum biogenesis ATPase FlaH